MKTKMVVSKDANMEVSKEKLMEDLRLVVSDAEDLLRATANQAGEGVAAVRARIQDNLQTVKVSLADAETAVLERTRQAAKAADQYVHENPWTSIGIAAGVGALVGILIARR